VRHIGDGVIYELYSVQLWQFCVFLKVVVFVLGYIGDPFSVRVSM
jgi:hypothetical protein